MTAREALGALVAALPPGAPVTVPREWVVELLAGTPAPAPRPAADLTVDQVAARVGRKAKTVRTWLETGALDGYKLHKTWRVPEASLARYLDGFKGPKAPAAIDDEEAPRLDAWRR